MNVFDLYLKGEVDVIDWNFYVYHFDDRLKDNEINLDYIKYLVLNEEPVAHRHSRDNRYEVFYNAPKGKKYNEIKIIFACHGISIHLISVMPNT